MLAGPPTPGRATSAFSGILSPTSMSVASSSGVAPSRAEIITPDSAWTALRVDATRVAVCSCRQQLGG